MQKIWSPLSDIRSVCTIKEIKSQDINQLPQVKTIFKTPSADRVGFIACDGVYFEKFGSTLLDSIKEPCHVHVFDTTGVYETKLIEYFNRPIGLTIEQPRANALYYHAIRFCRFYQFLQNNNAGVLLDADSYVNKPLSNLTDANLAMRLRPGRLEPWNQFNASVVVASNNAIEYMEAVSNYLLFYYTQKRLQWGIDQAALFFCYERLKPELKVLSELEVDYDYRKEGIVWQNSSSNKFMEQDKSRQRYRDRVAELQTPKPEKFNLQSSSNNFDDINNLELDAKRNILSNPKEAKRLFLRLLRRCFEHIPEPPKIKLPDAIKPKRKIEKILYLPIEVSAREMPSRIWLGEQMKKRGWQVVIGARWAMQSDGFRDLPPGLILHKTANHLDVPLLLDGIKAYHQIAILDEELFGMLPNKWLYETSVSKQALDLADLICASSDKQKELLGPLTKTPITVTGNPRVQETNVQLGNEVLVCTMSATINNYARKFIEVVDGTIRVLGSRNEDVFRMLAEQIEHELELLPQVMEAIQKLRDAGEKVRVRVHPVEDPKLYNVERDTRSFTESLQNVKAVVYCSGCGTGLESALANVPSVRIGEGGHGLSSTFQNKATNIVKDVQHAFIPVFEESYPDYHNLPNALTKLQQDNAFDCKYFDLTKIYEHKTWQPAEFHANKVPNDPPGKKIYWRTSIL